MSMVYTPILQCPAVTNRSFDENYQLRWILVDANNKGLETEGDSEVKQRLEAMNIEVKFGYLVIRAPNMVRLDIPMDVLEDDDSAFELISVANEQKRAVSEGDLAAQWFAVYFNQPRRLMKLHPEETID